MTPDENFEPSVPAPSRRAGLSLFGIEIKIHGSLILLMAYLIFVTSLQFPLIVRDTGLDPLLLPWGPWVWATLLSCSLMLSVLIHELGHALTARSLGLKVRSITLMMLGGISKIDKIPERHSSEFLLAIAGPIVSFILYGLGHLIARTADSPGLVFFSYWFSRSNLILGIFNLLPAFPLDGGRVLRALLALRFGMYRATRISVRISAAFAVALGILGLLSFNIFLLLIAFFIYAGAQSEVVFETSREHLQGVLTESVAIRIPSIMEGQTMTEAAAEMIRTRQPILPVRTRNRLPALIQVEKVLQVPNELWNSTLVRDVMDSAQSFATPSDPLSTVFETLATAPNGTIPLREENEPVGIVRLSDLSRAATFKALQDNLNDALRAHPKPEAKKGPEAA